MSTAGEKVSVVCPSCNKRLLVPGTSLGKQGRCPACQTVFTLEQLYEAEAVAPPSNDTWGAPPTSNSFGAPAASPFDNSNDDYQLQAAPPQSYASTLNNAYASPQINSVPAYNRPAESGQFWDSSVLGGIALMLIAVVWFFGALFAFNVFFIYPPILFIIGFITMVKGIFTGSFAGR